MNEPFDPLEAELEALVPRQISPDVQRYIAERLTVTKAEPAGRRWPWSVSLASALAAATIAAVLVWSADNRSWQPAPDGGQAGGLAAVNGVSPPTVQVYRRVLARSADALDAMLDKHASRVLPPDPQGGAIRAFSRLNELYSLGEM